MRLINLFNNIVLSDAAVLLGIVVLLGLVLQRRPFLQVISGLLKMLIGYFIVVMGTQFISELLSSLQAMVHHSFPGKGIAADLKGIKEFVTKYRSNELPMIMVFGFIVNIAIARFTPWKYIFLTVPQIYLMGAFLTGVLGRSGMRGFPLVFLGSIILGCLLAGMPALAQPWMRRINEKNDFALGHFGVLGYLASAYLGRWLGDPNNSIEKARFTEGLGFLKDKIFFIASSMVIVFIFIALNVGGDKVMGKGNQNYLLFSLLQGVKFAAGFAIILWGVEMMLIEIIQAFSGISGRLAPGALPALDCYVLFPLAPRAAFVGFLTSLVGGIIGMYLFGWFGLTTFLPTLIFHFYGGATAGIFGNAAGGRRGAVIGSLAHGLIISLLTALLALMIHKAGFTTTNTIEFADYGVVGSVLGAIVWLFK